MVSPNATDDPESAEQQPEVRALSDRRVPLDERGRGVKEHAETHCSVSWRCWSLSYVTATAAALQQAAPPLALDP